MATSQNFGNVFSLAAASVVLPFLPLLPAQILLLNLLTDFPEMTIGTDNVDPEMSERPRRMDIKFIRDFMVIFGPFSSVFDFAIWAVLIFIFHASAPEFRTGWWILSLFEAPLIVLVVRTRKRFYESRPSNLMLVTNLVVAGLAFILPFTFIGRLFSFEPITRVFFLWVLFYVGLYIVGAEVIKHFFYKKWG
jgi:Mg2+-importing ATPase